MTHTFAELQISAESYDEIAGLLRDADYHHCFQAGENGAIDMHGIALTRGQRRPEREINMTPDTTTTAPKETAQEQAAPAPVEASDTARRIARVDAFELKRVLALMCRVTAAHKNIRLFFSHDGILFQAGDTKKGVYLDLFIETEVQVEHNNLIIINPHRLFSIMCNWPRRTVTMYIRSDGHLELCDVDDGIRVGLATEFEHVDLLECPQLRRYCSIRDAELSRAFGLTECALADEPSRYAIDCVLLHDNRCVTTDGRRLSIAEIELEDGKRFPSREHENLLIPGMACELILELLRKCRESLPRWSGSIGFHMEETDPCFCFTCGRDRVYGNRGEHPFPHYDEVVPKPEQYETVVRLGALVSIMRMIELAQKTTNEQYHGMRMRFDENKQLIIETRAKGTSSIRIPMPGIVCEGEPITIGVNPQYMYSIIKAANDQGLRLKMWLRKFDNPIVFTSDRYTHVVMPVDVRDFDA